MAIDADRLRADDAHTFRPVHAFLSMTGIHHLWLFVVSGLLLNITPGPDSLLVMARSGAHGWRAGSAAALGIGAGTLVHVGAAALGLSALLAASATAFTVVKIAGAAYLVWMGIGMLRARRAAPPAADATSPSAAPPVATAPPAMRLFWQGFATNVLNPKVALFFLAFVPQFITPDAPSKAAAFLVLGTVFDIGGVAWLHVLALGTALARRHVRLGERVLPWLNRALGAMFVGLGVKLALGSR